MKAILVNEDRSLRWDFVPNPVLGNEDCLVKIEAAALNRADLMQRACDYPPPPGCPEWMGLEIAGTILDLGAEARMNFPGTARENWMWRMKDGALQKSLSEKIYNLTNLYGRVNKSQERSKKV